MDESIHAGDRCNLSPAQNAAIAHLVTGIWMVASAFATNANDGGGFYTSHELPPGVRRKERFHQRAKKLSTAQKVGRTWIVPREDWHRSLTSSRRSSPTPTTPAPESVEAILAARGVRLREGRAA